MWLHWRCLQRRAVVIVGAMVVVVVVVVVIVVEWNGMEWNLLDSPLEAASTFDRLSILPSMSSAGGSWLANDCSSPQTS